MVLVNFSLCDKKKYVEEEKRKVRERLLQKPKEQRYNNLYTYVDKEKAVFILF